MKGEREKGGARRAAKLAGSLKYETGLPCAHGHVGERYTSTGMCVPCAALAVRAQNRTEYFRERYAAKSGEIRRYQRERYEDPAVRDQRTAYTKSWQSRNPGLVQQYKRKNKHKRRACEGVFSQSDVDALVRIQRGACAACDAVLNGKFHVDHIIPLALGGTNWCGNLQLLCARCNQSKAAFLPIVWRVRKARHTVNARMFA